MREVFPKSGDMVVSVHACGGIFGSIRSVGLRCGCGGHRARSAKVELEDFNLKHARGPDDRREIGAGRVAGEGR